MPPKSATEKFLHSRFWLGYDPFTPGEAQRELGISPGAMENIMAEYGERLVSNTGAMGSGVRRVTFQRIPEGQKLLRMKWRKKTDKQLGIEE